MRGVKFGNLHTFEQWKLILTTTNIGFPETKTEIVDVPGADGELDFTTSLTDDVKYKNRTITFTFVTLEKYKKWKSLLSEIANYLHGQKFKIILDEDPNFYYYGRAKINQFQSNKSIGTITIECDVEPYKYDLYASNEDWLWNPFSFEDGIINETKDLQINESLEVKVYGRRKKVVPKITCDNPIKLIFKGQEYNLPSGTSYSPDIEICEGENILKFVGTGTVTIEYRGGSL